MKTLRLLLNIGKRDAQRLALKQTQAGQTVAVEAEVADELLRSGWAVEPDRDAPAPEAVPTTSTTVPPVLEDLTKEELKAHADRLKIDGVTLALTKDDMIKIIKKASKP